MFDIKWIRDNAETFDNGLKRRGLEPLSARLIELDDARRRHQTRLQEAQSRRNAASKEIGKAMGAKDTATTPAASHGNQPAPRSSRTAPTPATVATYRPAMTAESAK